MEVGYYYPSETREEVVVVADIVALLRDPARMQQLSGSCAKRDYTNSAEVEKLYALMED